VASLTPTLMTGLQGYTLFQISGAPLVYTHNHRLSGTVAVNEVAAVKRVVAVTQGTLALVDSTTSRADGTWDIKGIPAKYDGVPLTVIATDHTDTYNAEIADNVKTVGIGEAK